MAADPNVKLHFAAEAKGADAVIAGLERKLVGLDAKMKFGGGRGGRGGMAEFLRGLKDVTSEISQAMLGFNIPTTPLEAVREVIAAIRREIEDLQEVQAKAANVNIGFSGAFAQAFINLDRDPTLLGEAKLRAEIARVSETTGVKPRDVALALSDAFSARGELPATDAVRAVEATLLLVRDFPARDRAEIAGAVLDIRKTDPKITEEGALGFISRTATASRVTDFGILAKNVIGPIVANVLGDAGTDLSQSAALITTISQFMGDKRGRRSANAGIHIVRRLKEELRKIPRDELPADMEEGFVGRLHAVQRSERLKNIFRPQMEAAIGELGANGTINLKGAFSVKARDTLEQLLEGGNRVADTFESRLRFIPDPTSKEAVDAEKFLRTEMMKVPAARVAHLNRMFRAGTERLLLSDEQRAMAGAIREQLPELLQASGVGFHRRKAIMGLWEAETLVGTRDALGPTIETLEGRVRDLRSPRRSGFYGGAMGYAPSPVKREATELEKQQAADINTLVVVMKELHADMKGNKPRRNAHVEKAK